MKNIIRQKKKKITEYKTLVEYSGTNIAGKSENLAEKWLFQDIIFRPRLAPYAKRRQLKEEKRV